MTGPPIGNYSASTSNQYTGTFDGQDHTIDGMVVNNSGSSYQGFVGYLGGSGCIRNLTLGQGCSVTGKDKVGGVCGSTNEGTIPFP